ncbi:MAG: DUF2802 domain-containing protein [Sterolibacterium sp.]
MNMDFTEFSIRYAIICAVAVVAVFLLVSLAGLVQIKLRQRAKERTLTLDGDEVYWIAPEQSAAAEAEETEEVLPESWRAPLMQDQPPSQFGEQLFRTGVEAELQQLRSELAGIKENMAQLKAARRVSPQYNEAMLLAQRGMGAHDIAETCGISMGEAELVLSLSRNKQEYEDHDR